MLKKQFVVALEKEHLIFSAAHFITFGENVCESLHGHNYRVACEVVGELNQHAYVVDFIALRDRLHEIVKKLDHKVLLPTRHQEIRVKQVDREITAQFRERHWVFPEQDCFLLPVDNTTAERLAEYLAEQLISALDMLAPTWTELAISIDENEGQWGRCRIQR